MQPRLAVLVLAALSLATFPALARKKESVVYSFGLTSADASGPQDGLIADKLGNLYGTTIAGGLHNKGTVFVVGTNGLETVIYSFTGGTTDGEEPNAALAMDKKGNLYGTTLIGGGANQGTIFELSPNGESYTEKTIYSFCAQASCADGATPAGPITVGPQGVLYGTAQLGGLGAVTHNSGVAFRLDPPAKHETAWSEAVLYAFCSQSFCADGKFPYAARLLLGSDGFLYGTASQSQQGGTLYRVSPGGGGFSVLHTFTTTGTDGQSPITGVVADKQGIFYGTTRQGGTHGCGTAYSFNPTTFAYAQIYNFCDQAGDGTTLYGGLTVVQGKGPPTFYGAALAGGANGHGAIYTITPPATEGDNWHETTLYSFCPHSGCADGSTPAFATLVNLSGVLYGTTTGGGAQSVGTVYRYGKP